MSRLTETRGRCKVYVLPEYVNGRPTEEHGVVHKADKRTLDAAQYLENYMRRHEDAAALFDMDMTQDEYAQAIWALINYAKGRRS